MVGSSKFTRRLYTIVSRSMRGRDALDDTDQLTHGGFDLSERECRPEAEPHGMRSMTSLHRESIGRNDPNTLA